MKVEIIPENEAERPAQYKGLQLEIHKALREARAGQVVRVTTDSSRSQGIGSSIAGYAKKAKDVEFWKVDGVYYVKRLVDVTNKPEPSPEPVKLPDPGRCPRCNGQLLRSRELDGVLVKCISCGFEPTTKPEDAGIAVDDRIRRREPSHAGGRL